MLDLTRIKELLKSSRQCLGVSGDPETYTLEDVWCAVDELHSAVDILVRELARQSSQ